VRSPWITARATNVSAFFGGLVRVRNASASQERRTFSAESQFRLLATTVHRSAFCSSLIGPLVGCPVRLVLLL